MRRLWTHHTQCNSRAPRHTAIREYSAAVAPIHQILLGHGYDVVSCHHPDTAAYGKSDDPTF